MPGDPFTVWNDSLNLSEGSGLSLNPNDPGNWTGGKIGLGELKGTKFGIAAASHPTLDIANLTIDQAIQLRRTEYWDVAECDTYPGPVAFLMAEACYGSYVVVANKTL